MFCQQLIFDESYVEYERYLVTLSIIKSYWIFWIKFRSIYLIHTLRRTEKEKINWKMHISLLKTFYKNILSLLWFNFLPWFIGLELNINFFHVVGSIHNFSWISLYNLCYVPITYCYKIFFLAILSHLNNWFMAIFHNSLPLLSLG